MICFDERIKSGTGVERGCNDQRRTIVALSEGRTGKAAAGKNQDVRAVIN